jgi:acyl CoA:acetate/3-ketoacid CoA transferase beta subunit
MAGALGVPFLPVNSLGGSGLAAQDWVATTSDPFGGGAVTVVAALQPDVVVLHGVAADPDGNVILSPPYGETAWGSLAARRGVIATVEKVLDAEDVRRYQSLVKIPAHVVRAVCPLPLGAHPYGLYSPIPEVAGYAEDDAFILDQRAAAAEPARQRAWVDTWIHSTPSHADYLDRLGADRLGRLLGAATPGAWSLTGDAIDRHSPAAAEERMTIEAARVIEGRIAAGGVDVLMTGIGYANLAAWVAHGRMVAAGRDVPLMAEIGAYGYDPRPGDPFIFSHRNLPTCSWMTDVAGILGSIVAGRHGNCLAVVGAGAIDRDGNVNSSRTGKGGFLVGSGGANDIASGAAELIVVLKHGRHRLVPAVPFVTCPGERVGCIVTTEAVLERDRASGGFVVQRVLDGTGGLACAVERVRAGCGFDLDVARDISVAAPVDRAELDRLRSFDPRGSFLPLASPAADPGRAVVAVTAP